MVVACLCMEGSVAKVDLCVGGGFLGFCDFESVHWVKYYLLLLLFEAGIVQIGKTIALT